MMPDMEKVILLSDLNDISEILNNNGYGGWCVAIRKAIAQLKEQETANLYKCPNCGTWVSAENVVRCKDCRYGQYCTDGETTYQCFKWNSGEFGVLHEQNWFCADGVKRELSR
jgi:predicted RNA-binding Zn-ribbon protein involved in translation (DUF1610 family)